MRRKAENNKGKEERNYGVLLNDGSGDCRDDLLSEYREIRIDHPQAMDLSFLINKLFSNYPREGVFFKLTEEGLKIYLKEIDFFDFKERINALKIEAEEKGKELLELIFSSIDGIKSYGLKGRNRLYVGYDKERKVKDRKEKELGRGRYFYARDNDFSAPNNPLSTEFLNRIIVGDSEEVLKGFPPNCIDLILTSPPYNFGLEYDTQKDGIDWKAYFKKLFAVFKECIRVLKYGGRIIVNVQPLFSDYIPIHHIISDFFIKNKLVWKGEILWDKHNYNCKYTAWGSWKSSHPILI